MEKKLIYIPLIMIIIGCSNDELIVEEQVEPEAPKKKYRTYKRITPMIKSDRMNLERTSDIEDARRYILKTFDSYQSKIPSVSNPE